MLGALVHNFSPNILDTNIFQPINMQFKHLSSSNLFLMLINFAGKANKIFKVSLRLSVKENAKTV